MGSALSLFVQPCVALKNVSAQDASIRAVISTVYAGDLNK